MAYKDGEVQWIPVDPFDPDIGRAMLFPLLLKRMLDFAQIHYAEMNPLAQVRSLASKACKGDPVLLLAAVTPDGKLIGHTACVLQEEGGRHWVFMLQSKLDEPSGDAIQRALEIGKAYARKHGAEMLIFESKRSDSAWVRAVPGIKTLRHFMYVPVDGTPEKQVSMSG